MIETPHAKDCRRRVPVFSLYSDTREPTTEMLEGLDLLVVDLQDVGTRVYTYIYTMANCMRAAARHGAPGRGLRSAKPDRRRHGRGRVPGRVLQLVCRTVSDSDASRHDDRRAGPAFQRRVSHRRQARRRSARGLASIDVLRRDRPSVHHPVAEPPDARQRHRLSGRRARRGHAALRGPRHNTTVRTDRSAVDRRRPAGGRHERPGLPGVHFRAAFFEPTFQKHARQSCGGCQIHVLDRSSFQPLRTTSSSSTNSAQQIPRGSPGASHPTSTSTRSSRSTSLRIGSPAPHASTRT